MSIQEILGRHKVAAFTGADTACSCDRTWRTNTEYRAHVAEVLDKHMQEALALAWEGGATAAWDRSNPSVNGTTYHWRVAGEPANPYRKETPNGR